MHIKMNDFRIDNILESGFSESLENVYSQAKRTNTLAMVKVLIGQVYTVSVKLFNVRSAQMRQIQKIALLPEIDVEFYSEDAGGYITQNMYCKPIKKTVNRELKNIGIMLYDDVTLEFTGNYKVER